MKKILSIFLSLMLTLSIITIGNTTVYAVDLNSPAYTTLNPYPYGQCTWYAWGRTKEVTGISLPSYLGNAKDWYANAAKAGYSVGSVPRANSIAVWYDVGSSTSGYGHVTYVESVNGTTMNISEGNYNGTLYHTATISTNGVRFAGTVWEQRITGYIYLSNNSNGTPGSFTVSSKDVFNSYEDVIVNWTTAANAVKYGLTVRKYPYTGDQNIVFDNYVYGNQANIGKLPAGDYRFAMAGYNSAGTMGPVSNIYYFKVISSIPSTPASVKAASSSYNSIKITWGAVTGINGYEIYRAASSTGTYSKLSDAALTSFTNTGLSTGTTYYYKVRAYVTYGTTRIYGNFSAAVYAKPIPGTPASVKAASSSYSSIKIIWAAVTGASGYHVYRASSGTGTYAYIGNTANISFNNTGLTTGKTYYYKVRAYRTVGTSGIYSNYSAAAGAKPVPSTPSGVKAVSYSYNSNKISWAAVSGATGYNIYRSTSSTGTYSYIKSTSGIFYINSGLTTGKTYYYKIRAFRTVGTVNIYSNYSVTVSAQPIPSAPANFKAVRYNSTSIKLTWSSVSGSSGYQVYRALSSTGTFSLFKTTSNLYYINTGLITGRTYYYKARAYRIVGTTIVFGKWTTVAYAKP